MNNLVSAEKGGQIILLFLNKAIIAQFFAEMGEIRTKEAESDGR